MAETTLCEQVIVEVLLEWDETAGCTSPDDPSYLRQAQAIIDRLNAAGFTIERPIVGHTRV